MIRLCTTMCICLTDRLRCLCSSNALRLLSVPLDTAEEWPSNYMGSPTYPEMAILHPLHGKSLDWMLQPIKPSPCPGQRQVLREMEGCGLMATTLKEMLHIQEILSTNLEWKLFSLKKLVKPSNFRLPPLHISLRSWGPLSGLEPFPTTFSVFR